MKAPLRMACILTTLGLCSLLPAQGQAEKAASPDKDQSVLELIEDLGSQSFKDRIRAERELRRLGEKAVSALEKAAEDDSDKEVQWRARRLLRQIEGGNVEERDLVRDKQEPRGPRGFPSARDQFEDIFRRMERDFGLDIPRHHFFQDDFFQDLDAQLREMQQRMQKMRAMPQGGIRSGTLFQVTPDGVRLEVEETNEKGEVEKKVYEAPDMETFRDQYGDVLEKHGLNLGFGGGGLPFGQGGKGRVRLHPAPRVLEKAPESPPPGERLGVFIRGEVPPALREYLELEHGLGLMIDSVQDDSLAERLGLRKGDIVTSLAGHRIGSPADVREALRAVEAGQDVVVEFLRKGSPKTAKAKKP